MKYTQEMMLQSDSGYCMPFEEKGKDVEMSLGYGKQKHPKTGETFFHHGVDFPVKHYLLSAIATGKVSGLGNDAVHGIYQVIRYGKYEVTYAHLSNVFAKFDTCKLAHKTITDEVSILCLVAFHIWKDAKFNHLRISAVIKTEQVSTGFFKS